MSAAPLVSVIIPTYNRAALVCQAIENVFEQTYRNFELIVVDDGSRDNTLEKLSQYGDRIRVIAQANAGPAVARNRGAAGARGDIIAFQDSDDLWKPTKLERQVTLLEKAGASVPCCLCNAEYHHGDGKVTFAFDHAKLSPKHQEGVWLNVAEVLATRFVLFNQCAAIRRKAFEKLGGFNEKIKYLEDYDLPLRLAIEGPWACVSEPLTIERRMVATQSFALEAQQDEVFLAECAVQILDGALDIVKSGEKFRPVRRQLRRRLSGLRRELRGCRLSRMEGWGLRTAGTLLRRLEHYRMAAFRRSPWFPRMELAELSGVKL
jgi:glycosyltransferase involved in cell wall biosynthesis